MAEPIHQQCGHINHPIPKGPEATILWGMRLINFRRILHTLLEVATSWTLRHPCSVSLNMEKGGSLATE